MRRLACGAGLATGRFLCPIGAGPAVVAPRLVIARGGSGPARLVATFIRRWCRTRRRSDRRGRGLTIDRCAGLGVDAASAAASTSATTPTPSRIAHGALFGRTGRVLRLRCAVALVILAIGSLVRLEIGGVDWGRNARASGVPWGVVGGGGLASGSASLCGSVRRSVDRGVGRCGRVVIAPVAHGFDDGVGRDVLLAPRDGADGRDDDAGRGFAGLVVGIATIGSRGRLLRASWRARRIAQGRGVRGTASAASATTPTATTLDAVLADFGGLGVCGLGRIVWIGRGGVQFRSGRGGANTRRGSRLWRRAAIVGATTPAAAPTATPTLSVLLGVEGDIASG
ncbi:MAG: hypothetical protein AABZ53_01105 [Planctomycetota bacterium]